MSATPSALLADEELGKRAVSRARRRLLPFLLLLYFINYLDRNNVGFAQLQMRDDVGLTATAYGFGAGIFFLSYFLFEVPSNAGMHRFGARIWLGRILVSWGVVAACMVFVQSATSYAVLRFLLGAAEAGFFPGVILYLTLWFPARVRVGVVGLFVLAQPLSNGLGAPLSGWLLGLDGLLGLAGWQWMFVLEGVPAIVLGVVTFAVLPDSPSGARWLPEDERRWLQASLEQEESAKESRHGSGFLSGLRDPKVLGFATVYFALCFGVYGLSLWLPTIVDGFGGLTGFQVGMLVLIPYAVATVAVWLWSRDSDRRGERVLHTAVPMAVGGVGLVVSAFTLSVSPVIALISICVVAAGMYSAISPFWGLPAGAFSSGAAAAGIAAVNSLGCLAGFVAPYAVGALNDRTGDARSGLILLACVLVAGAVFCVWYCRRHEVSGGVVATRPTEGAGARQPAG